MDTETTEKPPSSPAGENNRHGPPILSVQHLVKTFGPIRTVDGVSLDLYAGEVVGLVGDNGAGKSTFLSLLTGYNHADSGTFLYRGKPISHTSTATSRKELKIEMIYQHLDLAPDLTVWQKPVPGRGAEAFPLFPRQTYHEVKSCEGTR